MTCLLIEYLFSRVVCFFEFFSLNKAFNLLMHVVIFEFIFDVFPFAFPPVWFIHFLFVLFFWYLEHACPWWFRFSLILSRHYFFPDPLNKWLVCWLNIFFRELFICFFISHSLTPVICWCILYFSSQFSTLFLLLFHLFNLFISYLFS